MLLKKAVSDLSLYGQQLEEKTLLENRRSSKAVVGFNNEFFKLASRICCWLPKDCLKIQECYLRCIRRLSSSQNLRLSGNVCNQVFRKELW